MKRNEDIQFMKRAIAISRHGLGLVNPNPLVGALIVKSGKIIGEGYHEYFGGAHAEVTAINSATEDVRGATIYVSLEPCSHHGKTPPCSDRIIAEGFARVVIGMNDPNPLVNGKGIQKLKEAGIQVETGILSDEIELLNEVFIKYICKRQAFVALKTAMTMDGKIASYSGHSKWVTGEESRAFVHDLRHQYAAIMVGVNTVIEDDPLLTDRSDKSKPSHPVRIIVDSKGRTPIQSKILNCKDGKTIVATTKHCPDTIKNTLKNMGVEVLVCDTTNNQVSLTHLIKLLSQKGIDSILIEGGSQLNFSAIEAGIVDKTYNFIAPKFIGGTQAKTAMGGQGFKHMDQAVPLHIQEVKRFGNDILLISYIHKNKASCSQE